jgi:hypothetical protein
MRQIELVATLDAIKKLSPALAEGLAAEQGPYSANFPCMPADCQTALGTWLANNVTSTRFGNPNSECILILPQTVMGLSVRSVGDRLTRTRGVYDLVEAEALFQSLESWISEERAALSTSTHNRFTYIQKAFQWPVYGSTAQQSADTPERYFDHCAKLIRATGGVILRLGELTPPRYLLMSLAEHSGGGEALLRRAGFSA